MCKDTPLLLPKADSIVAMRAPFATHSLWVAPYHASQLYPAGKFVPREFCRISLAEVGLRAQAYDDEWDRDNQDSGGFDSLVRSRRA
jgi:Cu2+-containing amine oxidase